MGLGWFRRRRSAASAPRRPRLAADPVPVMAGPTVLIERLDEDPVGNEIMASLGERYELLDRAGDGRRLEIVVDDTSYADEAVVHLACQLDQIDHEWERHWSWPRAQS